MATEQKTDELEHDCGPRFEPRIYRWEPRTDNPKACPRCKDRLDVPEPKEQSQ